MKIWVVWGEDAYEYEHVLKVFDNEEKAFEFLTFLNSLESDNQNRRTYNQWCYQEFCVVSYNVE